MWLVAPDERLSGNVAVGALDEAFHARLVEAGRNREMSRVHRELTERIRIIRRLDFTNPARIEATYDEHARIVRAIPISPRVSRRIVAVDDEAEVLRDLVVQRPAGGVAGLGLPVDPARPGRPGLCS